MVSSSSPSWCVFIVVPCCFTRIYANNFYIQFLLFKTIYISTFHYMLNVFHDIFSSSFVIGNGILTIVLNSTFCGKGKERKDWKWFMRLREGDVKEIQDQTGTGSTRNSSGVMAPQSPTASCLLFWSPSYSLHPSLFVNIININIWTGSLNTNQRNQTLGSLGYMSQLLIHSLIFSCRLIFCDFTKQLVFVILP